jgi:hypothetical protein
MIKAKAKRMLTERRGKIKTIITKEVTGGKIKPKAN